MKLLHLLFFSLLITTAQLFAASVSVSLAQSTHGTSGSTPVDLTAEGDLDWGIYANSTLTPSTRMSAGTGFTSMSYLNGSADAFYNFYSENIYSWTNGDSPASGSNNLTTSAILGTDGDGIRMTFTLASAGSYQLKFYATTYQTNLRALASLASGGVTTLPLAL